ncbi:MAG: DUF362 domain-containing protein [Nitrospirae bacterium]|nr:DUF362 domain-containing protein [Nitrospirota bacterium]
MNNSHGLKNSIEFPKNIADRVAVQFIEKEKGYPDRFPFDPPARYPEYTGTELDPNNQVYNGVRETFFRLGLDKAHFNTKDWNPFGDFIKPGMTVFIKANTVTHEHEQNKDVFSVIVHASVLRPVLDYVCRALDNDGRIIIGDSQLYYCDFQKAMVVSRIGKLLEWYAERTKVQFECFDLRINKAYRTWLYGRWGRKKVEQDPRGYRFVDLGKESYFNSIDPTRLRIAIAGHKNMFKHHSGGRHEYLFPGSFLQSDAVISIAKLKTHRRTGVTLALKNFMGIPALKDSLPHFMTGSVQEGGDQYIHPSRRKRIVTHLHDVIQTNPSIPVKFVCAIAKKALWNTHKIIPFKDDVFEAMWHGNDTLWRTLLDLCRAVMYADREGKIVDSPQRKLFYLIDGIVGGEKDGPLVPDPVKAGVLLAGFNAVTIDAVGATLMGFDINKIPLIKKGLDDRTHIHPVYDGTPEAIRVLEGDRVYGLSEYGSLRNLGFEPHPQWKGHIESRY